MATMTLVQVKTSESGVHHTITIDDPLRAHLLRQLVKGSVQREMFCPFTGTILDVRTVIAMFSGDPRTADFNLQTVFSPAAWPKVKDAVADRFPDSYLWHIPTSARKA